MKLRTLIQLTMRCIVPIHLADVTYNICDQKISLCESDLRGKWLAYSIPLALASRSFFPASFSLSNCNASSSVMESVIYLKVIKWTISSCSSNTDQHTFKHRKNETNARVSCPRLTSAGASCSIAHTYPKARYLPPPRAFLQADPLH